MGGAILLLLLPGLGTPAELPNAASFQFTPETRRFHYTAPDRLPAHYTPETRRFHYEPNSGKTHYTPPKRRFHYEPGEP